METCTNCGNPVLIQVMKGTGICSENCRKAIAGEKQIPRAPTDAGITNILAAPGGVDVGTVS